MPPSIGNAQWLQTSLRRPFLDRLAGAQACTGAGEFMGRVRATLLSGSSDADGLSQVICGTAGNHAGNRADLEQPVYILSSYLSLLELESLCVEH